MRTWMLGLLAAGFGVALPIGMANHASAGTTRIETRPFYGAVVTIEEGVRVFRPLPNTDRVIINPGGKTPLSLGFNETTVTERRYNYNYGPEARDDDEPRGVYGLGGFYGYGHRGHGRGGHRGGQHEGGHYGGGLPGRGYR